MKMEMPSPADKPLNSASGERSREDLEVAICQIWQEVFQQEEIGRDDNFFELGGNSLLGMDLTELLASRLDVHVPVLMIFQHPTISEMGEIICAGRESP